MAAIRGAVPSQGLCLELGRQAGFDIFTKQKYLFSVVPPSELSIRLCTLRFCSALRGVLLQRVHNASTRRILGEGFIIQLDEPNYLIEKSFSYCSFFFVL